jgi:hypothetical protein
MDFLRGRAGRVTVAVAIVGTAAGIGGGNALGIDVGGTTVNVPSVPSAPSVPQVPSTPGVPVQAPSAPQVSTPSAPHVNTPSVPSVSAPTSGGGSSGGGGGTGGQQAAGSGQSGSSSAPGTPAVSGGGAKASTPATQAARTRASGRRRQTQERNMRRSVRRMRDCLGSLPQSQQRYLSLRAGLDGAPRSAGQAAQELGVSRSQGLRIERSGMRNLRSAAANGCGSGPGATSKTVASGGSAVGMTFARTFASRATGMPRFQPAMRLVADTNPLVDPSKLRGSQQVGGIVASSGSTNDGWAEPAPLAAVKRSSPVATSSSPLTLWIILAGVLALMGITAFVGIRRRSEPAAATSMFVPFSQTLDVEPAPMPEPRRHQPTQVARPAARPVRDEAQHDHRRAAALVASGIASFAVRELMRRRRR